MKKILICGAGGFIGSHMVKKLKKEGCWVRGVDVKKPLWGTSPADSFIIADLRLMATCEKVFDRKFDEVYQLAADMGGAGYIFTGEHDADIMRNSALIDINIITMCQRYKIPRVFFSSSACIYPKSLQTKTRDVGLKESYAYPANPDSDYGWQKLFTERLFSAFGRNYGIKTRIARFHNIYGPEGTWDGGKEKAPAALCRKVAKAPDGGSIEIWGDGHQTRSFLFIDDCLSGTLKLMRSSCNEPLNIGSEEMVTINELAKMIIEISGKHLTIKHVEGIQGVRGRSSDNTLTQKKLGWAPKISLRQGIAKTYQWIAKEVASQKKSSN